MRILRRAQRYGRRLRRQLMRPIARAIDRRRLGMARRAIEAFPETRIRRHHSLPTPLIVSLTSWPPRFPTLAATLKGLLDQTLQPDRTILWIAHRDLAALPADVRRLEAQGLEIRGCDDLRSFKKLVPALEAFPDSVIVTADDDSYYPPHWLECLVNRYDADRPAIISSRAHLARFERDGQILPYLDWGFDTRITQVRAPFTALFPTGVGGVLYPPGALAPDVLDRDAFMALCPHADDAWFFWMARLQGTRHVRTPEQVAIVSWPSSQDQALFLENTVNQRNDTQLKRLEARYGRVGSLSLTRS